MILHIIIVILIVYLWNDKNVYKQFIYMDNNATTRPHNKAIEYFNRHLFLGNASAFYASDAKHIIDKAKALLLEKMGLSYDYKVIFTSGASESINTVFRSILEIYPNINIITSSYEHPTAIKCLKDRPNVKYINPDIFGHIDIKDVLNSLTSGMNLVSIMMVNNEIGSINKIIIPVSYRNVIYHSDCTQAFGKYPLVPAHMYSLSFHKINGFQGIGALVIHNSILNIFVKCPHIAGSQFNGIRGGTENIPLIASTIGTLEETFKNRAYKNISLKKNRQLILDTIASKFVITGYCKYYKKDDFILGDVYPCEIVLISRDSINTIYCAIVPYKTMNFCSRLFQNRLFKENVIISIGSACGTSYVSHVLDTIFAPIVIKKGVIRISIGDYTNTQECKKFSNIFINVLTRYLQELLGQ